MFAFATLAVLAVALATTVARDSGLPDADWTPAAVVVAMKPCLEASTCVAGQAVAWTLVRVKITLAVLLLANAARARTGAPQRTTTAWRNR
jgi:hypothetical protein